MKCIKCGTEYEGEQCPVCNGPKILINNEDYLRRKREYEEKQKKLAQAEKEQATTLEDNLIKLAKQTKSKTAEKVAKIRKSQSSKENNEEKDKSDKDKSDKDKSNKSSKGRKKKNKNYRLYITLFILLIVILSGALGIYKLANRKHDTLYISSEGRIYDISNIENELICTEDKAIYTYDDDIFYTFDLPDMIKDFDIIASQASESGKYVATVVYNSTNQMYGIYLWNQQECILVEEDARAKEIKYVSDKGNVIFTDSSFLFENVVSSIALNMYEYNSKISVINENIRSCYIYLNKDTIVYLTSGNELYYVPMNNIADKKLVEVSVKDIYGPAQDEKNVYSNSTEAVKSASLSFGIVYSIEGRFYYNDFINEPTLLFQSVYSGVDIVYEKKANYAYCVSATDIGIAYLDDESIELTKLDDIASNSDVSYITDKNDLVYIARDGNLKAISKDNVSVLRENVSSGSLSKVKNINEAITYICDGTQYYRSSLNAREVAMQSGLNKVSTEGTLFYKNHLYYTDDSQQLYSCTAKGTDSNKLGIVTRFWTN